MIIFVSALAVALLIWSTVDYKGNVSASHKICLYSGMGKGHPNKHCNSEKEECEVLSNHCSIVILKFFCVDVIRAPRTQDMWNTLD